MKKLTITLLVTLVSTGAFAGCLQNAKELVATQRGYTLINKESIFLQPKTDTLAYGGEVYNSNDVAVEVFFTEKQNYIFTTYGALLFNKKTCDFLSYQSLGDDL